MKKCTYCHLEKPETEFDFADKSVGRRRGDCKSCVLLKFKSRYASNPSRLAEIRVSANRKYKYGVAREDVNRMLDAQSHACAICSAPLDYLTAHLDHCHETRKVRGLLCKSCNWGLGQFRDSVDLLDKAINYLRG